jgi:hypothetical protein
MPFPQCLVTKPRKVGGLDPNNLLRNSTETTYRRSGSSKASKYAAARAGSSG